VLPRSSPFWPGIHDLCQSCRPRPRRVRGEGGEMPVALELRRIILNFDTQRFKEFHILIADLEFRLGAEGRDQ
jgi:hypothetical protein